MNTKTKKLVNKILAYYIPAIGFLILAIILIQVFTELQAFNESINQKLIQQ